MGAGAVKGRGKDSFTRDILKGVMTRFWPCHDSNLVVQFGISSQDANKFRIKHEKVRKDRNPHLV